MTPERFRGRTMAEALAAVRRALGDEAVLLDTTTAADGVIEIAATAATAAPGLDDPRVELVVGLPGDGKTTVVGKLAVAAHRAAMRVALVATDTHRIGATAELDAIGRALGIPVVRATTPAAIAAVVERGLGVTRLLVDTTGVGPHHMAVLAEVAAIARASGAHARRTLVVSATTAPAVVAAALTAFDLLTPTCAVVAKADCAPWEPIASQIAGHGIVVRAVARSRSVADSLAPVSRGGLARRLLAA
jgi:fused signal recognition particle receptor